jgi:RND family efflux transporter MFP subunit
MINRQHSFRRVAALVIVSVVSWTATAQAQFGGPAPVRVAPVEQRTVAGEQEFVATVMPGRKTIVGSAVEGRVEEYFVNEGDYVTKGTVLAKLRTGTIQIELEEARAELDLRRHELDEMRNGSRPDEIAEVEARTKSLESRADFVKSRLRRQSQLYEKKTISHDDYEDAVSGAAVAEHQLREAQAQLRLVQEGPRKEKIAQMAARVKAQEEAVNHIQDRLDKYTVRAYFDGYITQELTEVGYWLKSSEPIVEMVALDHVEVKVMVLEDYVPHLKRGQAVTVAPSALKGETFDGIIERIVPQADVRSRTFPVHIRVENPMRDGLHVLKAGMLAKVRLPVGNEHQALLVPKDAVVLGGPSPIVYAVRPAPTDAKKLAVVPVPVKLFRAVGRQIEVTGELQPGENVVTQGNERLRPGQDVAVMPADAATKPVEAPSPTPSAPVVADKSSEKTSAPPAPGATGKTAAVTED